MFIFNKKTNDILNTEQIIRIYINIYNEIHYDVGNNGYNKFAEYETPERAEQVLRQIFIAMTDGLKTFELPED